MEANYNIAAPFLASAARYPERPAIWADGVERTYAEVLASVRRIAHWLTADNARPAYVGILASRSREACEAILATAWAGATYVPLNLNQPAEALIQRLRGIPLDALIADKAGEKLLTPDVLQHAPRNILAPSSQTTFDSLQTQCDFEPRHVGPNDAAYIEFTSGSTGTPKGVVIPNGGVAHFCGLMRERYEIGPEDRIAETADTSFDISVFNMFVTWLTGASLHVVPKTQAIAPAKFIREHEITVWFSVPSVGTAMTRMGMLGPGAFPSLRVSLFSGEPLPLKVAIAWKQAAPNSVVDNLYGPTEATVICLHERVGDAVNVTREREIVSIGKPLPGTEAAIWDSARNSTAAGVPGELAISGPQLALGYFNDAEKTAARFVEHQGRRWYLTGDLAYQDSSGLFHHLGRIDNQVKVLGYRVELEEVETHLRQLYGTDAVAAIAWPIEFGAATGIVGFVSAPRAIGDHLSRELHKRMPSYMVPSTIHVLDDMPLNSSGKVDRKTLAEKLREGEF